VLAIVALSRRRSASVGAVLTELPFKTTAVSVFFQKFSNKRDSYLTGVCARLQSTNRQRLQKDRTEETKQTGHDDSEQEIRRKSMNRRAIYGNRKNHHQFF
jgi:hypothetical protein